MFLKLAFGDIVVMNVNKSTGSLALEIIDEDEYQEVYSEDTPKFEEKINSNSRVVVFIN